MEADWSKPRKIFHFDTLENRNEETDEQFFQAKKATIEKTVVDFLLSQQPNLSLIVPMSRALQSLLIRRSYPLLLQSLVQIFQFTYHQLLQQSEKQPNILLYILGYYLNKKDHYRTLFTILNNYMSPYSGKDSTSIEEKAYKILCEEMMKSQHCKQIGREVINIVQHFRQTQDHKELLLFEMQLDILASLGIYKHFDQQVLQQSKQYFSKKSGSIPKNEDLFDIIQEAMKRQTLLNKILKPSENTVNYLQKEFIEKNHHFLLNMMNSLIQQNKFEKLKLLWKFSSKLGSKSKQYLESHLKDIVKSVQLFLGSNSNISKILLFRDKIQYVIAQCFASSRNLQNILYNTIQEVLIEGQVQFNKAFSDKIFEQEDKESYQLIQQLFKLIPNKEKFMKEFEVRFFKWVIYSDADNIHYQQGVVHMMKKQCGTSLCKKIERMVFDVWREGKMVYYFNSSAKFKCRLLSINDWPKFKFSNIVLPDKMKEMIEEFEKQFKKSPENALKELQWVSQLGTIEMSINGVTSCFSEIEAALIFILDKSFRPLNASQLSEILNAKQQQISEILTSLSQSQILELNQHNNTYDIDDNNIKSYVTEKKEKYTLQEVKQNEIKDNSIIIDAAIVKILKRKKLLPRTELGNILLQNFERIKPKIEQINQSVERLEKREFLDIDKTKGILHYRE